MPTDWKDMLSSLKDTMDTGNVSEDETTAPEPEEENKIQKTPVSVVTDKKGRNGKTATIIEGFTIPQEEVEKLAAELKSRLGVGGSTREGEILIQGDWKQKVAEFLKKKNFKIR